MPTTAAADVPGIRRTIAEWLNERGTHYYTDMIHLGKQPVRPPGPIPVVGASLAIEEHRRITQGELWHISPDMCELIQAAHHTMPRFAPTPQDLPSPYGLVVFANPIISRDPGEEIDLPTFLDRLDIPEPDQQPLISEPIGIGAVSWGPCPYPNQIQMPAGGVWMTFYSHTRLDKVTTDAGRRAATLFPDLLPDNEAVAPWTPDGADPSRWMLPEPSASMAVNTSEWAAMVFAVFRLAGQGNLSDQAAERPPRPERRRAKRAELPERDVHVVTLRGSLGEDSDAGGMGREYRHRWVVRGHWRNQPWGPKSQLRRPVWILPHVKGPANAPLLGGEKVTSIAAPRKPVTTTEGALR